MTIYYQRSSSNFEEREKKLFIPFSLCSVNFKWGCSSHYTFVASGKTTKGWCLSNGNWVTKKVPTQVKSQPKIGRIKLQEKKKTITIKYKLRKLAALPPPSKTKWSVHHLFICIILVYIKEHPLTE